MHVHDFMFICVRAFMNLCTLTMLVHEYSLVSCYVLISTWYLQALPACLKNLVKPELELIRKAIAKPGNTSLVTEFPDGPKDPCEVLSHFLHALVSWFNLARKSLHNEWELLRLAKNGWNLQELIIQYFPTKDGKHSPTFMVVVFKR